MKKRNNHKPDFSPAVRLLFLAALMTLAGSASAQTNAATLSKPVSEMSIEELVNLPVGAATLGSSEFRKVPAAVTSIGSEEIRDSGARSLNELLEIYVPNLLYLRQNWEASGIGIRGIPGSEKFLLLVNGQVMNNFTHAGSISERDLVMLGDIKQIEVIRGPGSAVYGAGAIIGVIDIKTFSGKDFTGTEVTAKAGEIEQFYSAEIKRGIDIGDNAHLFLYAGISDLEGADRDAAPMILALNGSTFDGRPIVAGKAFPGALREDREAFRGLPPVKLHAEWSMGNFSLWARYTRGGERLDLEQRWLIQAPQGFATTDPLTYQRQEVGYQQISAGADYKQELSEHWQLAYRAGISIQDFVRREFDGLLDANREDIYTGRVLATWDTSPAHSLTFGFEHVHGEFGRPTLGYPGGRALSVSWVGIAPTSDEVSGLMPRWSTDTCSFLAEDRWDISRRWSLFTDLRIDKNDFTDYMFSPRAALIYSPSTKDTFKLILSQAVKANFAEMLKFQHDATGGSGDTETLQAVEISYQRLVGENLSLGMNGFFNHFRIIDWDDVNNETTVVGDLNTAGFELEALYQTHNFQMGISHSYTRLLDFRNQIGSQFITAEPYGFGHDLNHWSTHITKLHFTYRPFEKLRFTGSLRVFWGWPGWQDFSDYENSVGVDDAGDPLTNLRAANYNPFNKIQARLNLGVIYQVTPRLTASVHGYNLLGLLDGHYNDRLIMYSSSAQRDAAAVAVSISYKF